MAINIVKLSFADVYIEGLSEWMWRGMSYEAEDFEESARSDLEDGTQVDFRMYSSPSDSPVPEGQESIRRACVRVKPLNPSGLMAENYAGSRKNSRDFCLSPLTHTFRSQASKGM